MYNTGGVGGGKSHLLCGHEQLENILPIIFRCVVFFQWNSQQKPLLNLAVVESVRQQYTALAFRYFGQTGNGACHILQGFLQSSQTIMDFHNLLFCQNLAVIKQLL